MLKCSYIQSQSRIPPAAHSLPKTRIFQLHTAGCGGNDCDVTNGCANIFRQLLKQRWRGSGEETYFSRKRNMLWFFSCNFEQFPTLFPSCCPGQLCHTIRTCRGKNSSLSAKVNVSLMNGIVVKSLGWDSGDLVQFLAESQTPLTLCNDLI